MIQNLCPRNLNGITGGPPGTNFKQKHRRRTDFRQGAAKAYGRLGPLTWGPLTTMIWSVYTLQFFGGPFYLLFGLNLFKLMPERLLGPSRGHSIVF